MEINGSMKTRFFRQTGTLPVCLLIVRFKRRMRGRPQSASARVSQVLNCCGGAKLSERTAATSTIRGAPRPSSSPLLSTAAAAAAAAGTSYLVRIQLVTHTARSIHPSRPTDVHSCVSIVCPAGRLAACNLTHCTLRCKCVLPIKSPIDRQIDDTASQSDQRAPFHEVPAYGVRIANALLPRCSPCTAICCRPARGRKSQDLAGHSLTCLDHSAVAGSS